MSEGDIILRPATLADLRHFANGEPVPTVKAIVAERNGELLGIGGLRYLLMNRQRRMMLFLQVTEEGRRHKRALLRAMAAVREMMRGHNVVAICNPTETGAPSLMKRMGLTRVAPSSEGDIYQCIS